MSEPTSSNNLTLVTTVVSSVATALMAIVTAWLGFETRRMARAAEAQISLQSQPCLSFRGIEPTVAPAVDEAGDSCTALRLALRLFNPGQVLVQCKVQSLNCSLGNVSLGSENFSNVGGAIHPKEDTTFFLPFKKLNVADTAAQSFDVEFSISYWATSSNKQVLKEKIRAMLLDLQPPRLQWLYLEGPRYV